MATIVASRYAVLSVDDGDGDNDRLYSSKKKKKINKKEIGTASETSGQTKSNNSKKNKKPEKNQVSFYYFKYAIKVKTKSVQLKFKT